MAGLHKQAPVGSSHNTKSKGDSSPSALHKMGNTRSNFEEARGKKLAREGKSKQEK